MVKVISNQKTGIFCLKNVKIFYFDNFKGFWEGGVEGVRNLSKLTICYKKLFF